MSKYEKISLQELIKIIENSPETNKTKTPLDEMINDVFKPLIEEIVGKDYTNKVGIYSGKQ